MRLFRSVLIPALALVAMLAALPARAGVDIQEITTPGGIDAWLVEEHSIPFVALELRFRGGTSLDAPDRRGAVNLMTGLLEEGTGDMDARDFARATEEIAAEFSYGASDDAVSVSARFLTETRDEAIELLRASITAPSLTPEAIERVRAQVIAGLNSSLKDPGTIARNTFASLVFGDHPYGSPSDGTIESVSALTRDDLLAAHKAVFARDRVYISAVGDITADELSALLDRLLGDLPETGAPLPGRADQNLPGGIEVIDFDTPQSSVIFGQPGIDREDPDFFAAYILNHIIGGGGFESRLMTEVREKRGLTYGVYTYLSDKDNGEIWVGSVSSANDRVAETIEVIREQWARIRNEGVSARELADAKTYITGAYPLRFDGNGPIANIAVGMQIDGFPKDYIATRNDRMNAVTLEDVNRVARELLDPDKLTFVVVGRPEGLSSTLN
ncbi:M16 family metallopeptidase [Roseovarius amoyensis]|uniref:M16 family metallopeptidase n=1 Tax=Roseovarius amoyensis TaxID=2211448 RepID=UPI000DBE24CD|nr:pitrilysin family protein [Roseovarius amoyensis]